MREEDNESKTEMTMAMHFRAHLQKTRLGIGSADGPCVSVSLEKITASRPTQIAVGYREVCIKLEKLHRRCVADSSAVIQKSLIPAIIGPGGYIYILDGHHMVLALHLAGHQFALMRVIADLSNLCFEPFWHALEERNWVHPFDRNGRRRAYCEMPSSILCLEDDSFRSLARALRRRGGFAKSTVPHADFAWADFLRCRIDPELPARDFPAALKLAQELAASHAADHLPGRLAPTSRITPLSIHLQ